MSLKDELEFEREILLYVMEVCKKVISASPEGSLRVSACRANHKSPQYFLYDEHDREHAKKGGIYIKKNQLELAKALANKSYCESLEKETERQLQFLEYFIAHYDMNAIYRVFDELREERQCLIKPVRMSDESFKKAWLEEEYTGKAFSEDDSEIYTERGERVRSKSEKMIADKLHALGVPYKYEHPLYLRGVGTVFPDFTLYNKRTREEVFLEHFGMMDDSDYATAMVRKLKSYERNGIYQGKNLIMTFETRNNPLDLRQFEAVLKETLDF